MDLPRARGAESDVAGAPALDTGRRRTFPTQQVVLILVALTTLVLVAYPLVWLFLGSLDLPGEASLQAFEELFTETAHRQALLNTLILAAVTGVASAILGVPLAWAAARTDLPAKGWLHAAVALTYMLPPYLTALAYITLAAPNSGYLNRLVVTLTGAESGPFNLFTFGGVAFVIALHVFSLVYFFTYTALLSVDGALEQSAQILGAGRLQILRTVTLPLVAPAITSGVLLAGIHSMALFGPQSFLGTPANVSFLPTHIYGQLRRFPPQLDEASALASVLVVLTVAGLFVQRAFLERKSYVTVTGKGGRAELLRLRRWKWPLMGYCWGVISIAVILPLGFLVTASFSESWLEPFGPSNWTFANYSYAIFEEQTSRRGIINSLRLAAGAATLCMVLGLFIAYIDLRTRARGRRLLDYLAIIPLGLPGTVLGLGLLQGWIRVDFPIYATIWILLIAYIVRFLPVAVRGANTSLLQLDPSLEEAGRITGATWFRSLTRITFPLLRPGLLVGWVLVFVPTIGELSATILLYTQGTETIPIAIFRLQELGRLEVVAALAVVTVVITLVALVIAVRVAGRGVGALVGREP